MHNKRILAIDPGTKNIGIAIFKDKQLLYYGVQNIPQTSSNQALLKLCKEKLNQLMDDFHPDIIVYEKTLFKNNPTSKSVNVFTQQIKSIGMKKNLPVIGIAATTVRKIVCGNGKATKRDVANILVILYPELTPYLIKDSKWKETFHYNMFDAVALRIALDEVLKKKSL